MPGIGDHHPGTGDHLRPESAFSLGRNPHRDPNSWETAYAIVGVDAESPEVCAKISPFAVDGAGFAAFGKQTWYVQSRCYYDIAVQTGNARLCTHVRSAHPLSSQVPS